MQINMETLSQISAHAAWLASQEDRTVSLNPAIQKELKIRSASLGLYLNAYDIGECRYLSVLNASDEELAQEIEIYVGKRPGFKASTPPPPDNFTPDGGQTPALAVAA